MVCDGTSKSDKRDATREEPRNNEALQMMKPNLSTMKRATSLSVLLATALAAARDHAEIKHRLKWFRKIFMLGRDESGRGGGHC